MAALTEEQTLIKDQAKAWATEQAPVAKFREMRDSGTPLRYSELTWQSMVEMGGPAFWCRKNMADRISDT